MMQFFYESLETVKKLKYPTKQDFINLTGMIFLVVIISAVYFVGVDTLFSSLYQIFYSLMK